MSGLLEESTELLIMDRIGVNRHIHAAVDEMKSLAIVANEALRREPHLGEPI